ncbi:MAG: MaoC family dehydratase [bacterium]|nr:MaoC family dehydratase [bacterium]
MLRNAKSGDSLPVIEKDIDQDRINRWAKLSGDFNSLHVDIEFAKASRFGGTIAHGPMSLAFLNELMMECFGKGWVTGGKLLEVRFVAPTRPGDKIQITGTVTSVEKKGNDLVCNCDLFIQKQTGEKTVVGKSVARTSEEN